jgi:peptide/nickel transport system permease protein
MIKYLIRRLFSIIPVLLGITLMTFVIGHVIPSDPTAAMLSDKATPEVIEAFQRRWGLDRPSHEQYLVYLRNLLSGDLGVSIGSGRPVATEIGERLPATVELALAAMFISVVGGILLGVLAAVKRGSWLDDLIRIISLAGVSAPVFWTGVLLIFAFYYSLNWLPAGARLSLVTEPPPQITGFYTVDSLLAGDLSLFRESLKHLVLPAFSLGSYYLAYFLRLTRSGIIEEMQKDYVRTAEAKGLRGWQILFRHALRNATLPLLSYSGVAFGGLLAGAVVTETIFAWPGLGRYAFRNATYLDFPAIMSVTLVIALMYSLVNLVVDILQAALDPRVRETIQ